MEMRRIVPGELPVRELHQFLIGSVAPRPIAFVSTLDADGKANLAPYSFFNAFSSNPPTLVFSSNRRVRDNTTKDTLHNVRATGECVVNAVSYGIIRQMAVCSVQYPHGVDEFKKSGLTPVPAEIVKPFRVAESPVHMECKVKDIITLGSHGGAGHLVICEVVLMHIAEHVIDERNRIDPHKIDLVGRLGRAYYTRASGDAVLTVVQAVEKIAIGYDALPEHIRKSNVLTGNQLGRLAGCHQMPASEAILKWREDSTVREMATSGDGKSALHRRIGQLIDAEEVHDALALALAMESLL